MEDGSADPRASNAPSDRDGRDSPDCPGAIQVHGLDFRTGSQGPLEARTIVQNRQILSDQLREIDDLMGFMDECGGHSDAAEGQHWAELHADVDRLVRDKKEMHSYVREANAKVKLRLTEMHKWVARFSEIADLDPHELVLIRDKLPANLGPALARLITFSYHDGDSIDKLPKRYRDLMGKDLEVLAQQAAPLAPSQDVSALRRDLQDANERIESARAMAQSKAVAMDHLGFEKEKAVVAGEKLRAQINTMSETYRKTSDALTKKAEENSRWASKYAQRCATMKEDLERQQGMLVDAEEEKQRLESQAADALEEVKLRNDKIKQLEERISLLAAAEQGSDSAFDSLKRTVERMNQQNELNQAMNEDIIEKMRNKKRLDQDRQQRKITQLEEKAGRLQRENNEIGVLRQDKAHLERDVKHLTAKVTALDDKQATLVRRSNGVWEEKLALGKKNDELAIRVRETESRLAELNNSYRGLQRNEASYLGDIERLKRKIEEGDSARDIKTRDLTSAVSAWKTRCEGLQKQNESLGQEVKANETAIEKVQKLVQCETRLRAEVTRYKRDSEDDRTSLAAADKENGSIRERLGASAAEAQALRVEAERQNILVDRLNREKSVDREKIRALQDRLSDAETEKNVRSGAVTRLEKQVAAKDLEIKRLVADVARFGATDEERQQLLAKAEEEVKRLRGQNADAEKSLEAERQKALQLAQESGELERAAHEQRIEADTAQESLRRSLARSEQLEQNEVELRGSVESMRVKQTVDAGTIWTLEQSVRKEKRGRETSDSRALRTEQELENMRDQHGAQLEKAQAELDEARAAADSMAKEHGEEALVRGAEVEHVRRQLTAAEESLSDARSRARESMEGLRGFLARLLMAPTDSSGAFEGLARQLQTRCTLESQEQPCGPGWVILETWGADVDEDAVGLPGRPEALMLELFRHAVVGRIDSRSCHQALRQAVEVLSSGTVVHPGIVGETATAFVRAAAERPEESFQAGLVFWQLLTVVEQRWGHADLRAVRDDLEGILNASTYSCIFKLVAGREELVESGECRSFSGPLAVVARAASPLAVLVDSETRSVRFFAKTRWKPGLWGFTIKPADSQQEIFLQSKSARDIQWAIVMEVV